MSGSRANMNVAEAVGSATEALTGSGVAEPAKEARSLLAFALTCDASFLIAHPEYNLTDKEAADFAAYLERRTEREPFQYITGRQEFYGLDFLVTPDVLIPRPETETLVEDAIEVIGKAHSPRICEIGVGSGCISIAVLKNVPAANSLGIDISDAALAIAQRNAEMHDVADRLTLRTGDIFDGITDSFDLIVSNPPYVPAKDIASLQAEVRDFEPRLALEGGDSGLDLVERIISDAPARLKPSGTLLMEIGFDQSTKVGQLFDSSIWAKPEFLPDLQGFPRIAKVILRQTRAI